MSTANQIINANQRRARRIILWLVVAMYTCTLPYVVVIFEALQRNLSGNLVGKIPLLIIFIFGAVFVAWGIKIRKTLPVIGVVAAGAIIVAVIISVEHNPNKHIHIPEYVLMTWILFETVSIDYRGKGMGILILVCASMLGVVDELLQGIHPARSYGWVDMLINFASGFMGVLTLMALRRLPGGDWFWIQNLKTLYKSWLVLLGGAAAAIWMCVMLFGVATAGISRVQIPLWLMTGILIVILAGIIIICYHGYGLFQLDFINQNQNINFNSNRRTALLWVIYPLTMLVAINALCMGVITTNTAFR